MVLKWEYLIAESSIERRNFRYDFIFNQSEKNFIPSGIRIGKSCAHFNSPSIIIFYGLINSGIVPIKVYLINGMLNCGELNRGRISSVRVFDSRNVNSGIFHGRWGDFGQFRWPNS